VGSRQMGERVYRRRKVLNRSKERNSSRIKISSSSHSHKGRRQRQPGDD
jgi:hypothetical protein